jgi:NAD(P)-dependent dehydrogenase (short-subunit alcohol dehydrogenase family)
MSVTDLAPDAVAETAAGPRVDRGTAIVTGGRRGIGAAVAMGLAEAGFAVAIVDIVEDEAAATTLRTIRSGGGRGLFLRADIADIEGHQRLIETITTEFGPLTCLVNNAGIQVPVRGDLLDTEPEVFDRLVGVNLRGTFFLTQAVARAMIAAPGPVGAYRSITVISSANAGMTSIEKGPYCLSKSALPMLTSLFATRLAEHSIDVFEVQPGLIRTEMTSVVRTAYGQQIAAGISPYRRWGEAEEVGAVIRTLASGQLPFSTGTMVPVGGGLNIHRL